MEINNKKFTRTKTIINTAVSIVLAIFLILLSNTIISDLDRTVEYPLYERYANTETFRKLLEDEKANNLKIEALYEYRSNISKMINTAENNKKAEQESFDNWIKTRQTLGKAEQDPEVLKRLAKLEDYKSIVFSWKTKSDSISNLITPFQEANAEINTLKNKEERKNTEIYNGQMNKYDLKVFLIRLLFTAPILILGIYLFLRHRKHKYSPLFMGVSLFSVYVFFFGLVPYLPSYGGYIRYTVGVLLTIGLGYYAIKRLKAYQERKTMELKSSSEERASKLQIETSEKAFNNHVCPSCGKDFLLKNWEAPTQQNLQTLSISNYCRHCGLQLHKECNSCSQTNYAHLPFCVKCGAKI